jgi:hypothetical protein
MVVLLVASFIIGWLVGAKQEQKRLAKYGTIGTKPKTQTDYQKEHKIPPCVGHAYSNTIKCECCHNLIDLDDTDWCDKCDRSIFDDSPCKNPAGGE